MSHNLGEQCKQDVAYSVQPVRDDSGHVVDYICTNEQNSCRWRICQCDRAFAHKIKKEV